MKTKLTFTGGKGVNLDAIPSELGDGVWSTMTNFLSRSGVDELWEGGTQQYATAVTPRWGLPYTSSLGTPWAVYASSTKLYGLVYAGGYSEYEITRYTDGIVVTNATRSGTTVTLTTASAHGLTAGVSVIDAFGFVPTTYNATAVTVASTPTATSLTYTVAVAPSVSPATVFGAYSGSSTSNFSALTGVQRHTGGAWNGLFLFNHPANGLYYWSGSETTMARKVPGFSGTATWNTAVSVRGHKGFIVALGKTENGTTKRQNVAWSASISDPASLPTSFASTSTNDAGETNLTETAGACVDLAALGDSAIVYMTDARYAMQYIDGGNPTFVFTRLPGNAGLLAPNCVASVPSGHVFLTPDLDVMIHNGGEAKSIAEGRVHRYLRSSVVTDYAAALCFLAVNEAKKEVWVFYPSSAGGAGAVGMCDRALAWNWDSDTWSGPHNLSNSSSSTGVSFAAYGIWPDSSTYTSKSSIAYFAYYNPDSTKTGIYYTVESDAYRWFGADLQGTLERIGIDAGDRDLMKTLHSSRWNIDSVGDTASIYHGAASFSDASPTYASAVTYTTATTDKANARSAQGRFLAIKLVTTPGNVFRVRSVDLAIAAGGKR